MVFGSVSEVRSPDRRRPGRGQVAEVQRGEQPAEVEMAIAEAEFPDHRERRRVGGGDDHAVGMLAGVQHHRRVVAEAPHAVAVALPQDLRDQAAFAQVHESHRVRIYSRSDSEPASPSASRSTTDQMRLVTRLTATATNAEAAAARADPEYAHTATTAAGGDRERPPARHRPPVHPVHPSAAPADPRVPPLERGQQPVEPQVFHAGDDRATRRREGAPLPDAVRDRVHHVDDEPRDRVDNVTPAGGRMSASAARQCGEYTRNMNLWSSLTSGGRNLCLGGTKYSVASSARRTSGRRGSPRPRRHGVVAPPRRVADARGHRGVRAVVAQREMGDGEGGDARRRDVEVVREPARRLGTRR
jgi:hypothetical protein